MEPEMLDIGAGSCAGMSQTFGFNGQTEHFRHLLPSVKMGHPGVNFRFAFPSSSIALNLSELLSLAPSSRRSYSYLHGFCAMIPYRGALFLVN